MDIWKGSTPTILYKFPFQVSTISALTFKMEQEGAIKVSKALSDFSTYETEYLYITLTQADTLALTADDLLTMQFKVQFSNNHVVPSVRMLTTVHEVIDKTAMAGSPSAVVPTQAIEVTFPEMQGAFGVGMGMAVVAGGGGTSNFDQLTSRPKYNGTSMTHETNIPEVKSATWDAKADTSDIPTKTSDLTNDSGFLTSVSWVDITGKPSTFTPSAHGHSWNSIHDKPSTFEPSAHTHDDRYYTESETDTLLSAKYEKPVGGIPKTDMSSTVQASLGLADSALQSHQDISGKVSFPNHPSDNKFYAMKNDAWTEFQTGGGLSYYTKLIDWTAEEELVSVTFTKGDNDEVLNDYKELLIMFLNKLANENTVGNLICIAFGLDGAYNTSAFASMASVKNTEKCGYFMGRYERATDNIIINDLCIGSKNFTNLLKNLALMGVGSGGRTQGVAYKSNGTMATNNSKSNDLGCIGQIGDFSKITICSNAVVLGIGSQIKVYGR